MSSTSSTFDSTSTPSQDTATLPTVVPSSSSAAASSSSVNQCFTPQATNYVQNPGFETVTSSTINRWNVVIPGASQWSAAGASTSSSNKVRSENKAIAGTTANKKTTAVSISQSISNLEAGSSVYIGGYVKSLLSSSTINSGATLVFTLLFDNVQVDKFVVTAATTQVYQQLSSASSVLVAATTVHTISLRIDTSGFQGDIYAADDFYVIPVSGPNGAALCSATVVPVRACLQAPSTNYVVNPGFDTRNPSTGSVFYPSWDVTQDSNWSPNSFVYSGFGDPGNAFRGFTVPGSAGAVEGTLVLKQGNIVIPDGAIITVNAYVQGGRESTTNSPYTISLKFDDQTMDSWSPKGPNAQKYVLYSNTLTGQTVVATGSDPHSISLVVKTVGVADKDIFFADNFSIFVIAGLNGQRLCPA
ncbi:hypothetical protein ACN47E_005375 [Coniothyrium glycines]